MKLRKEERTPEMMRLLRDSPYKQAMTVTELSLYVCCLVAIVGILRLLVK